MYRQQPKHYASMCGERIRPDVASVLLSCSNWHLPRGQLHVLTIKSYSSFLMRCRSGVWGARADGTVTVSPGTCEGRLDGGALG